MKDPVKVTEYHLNELEAGELYVLFRNGDLVYKGALKFKKIEQDSDGLVRCCFSSDSKTIKISQDNKDIVAQLYSHARHDILVNPGFVSS